jgi:hypothetical protein
MDAGKTLDRDSPRVLSFDILVSPTSSGQRQAGCNYGRTPCAAVRVGEVVQFGLIEIDKRSVWYRHGGTILVMILARPDSLEEVQWVVNLPAKQSS